MYEYVQIKFLDHVVFSVLELDVDNDPVNNNQWPSWRLPTTTRNRLQIQRRLAPTSSMGLTSRVFVLISTRYIDYTIFIRGLSQTKTVVICLKQMYAYF